MQLRVGLAGGFLLFESMSRPAFGQNGSDWVEDSAAASKGARLDVGLRAGYGAPLGQAVEGAPDISTLDAGHVPFQLDLGVRFDGRTALRTADRASPGGQALVAERVAPFNL